jgi:hypothetical protein
MRASEANSYEKYNQTSILGPLNSTIHVTYFLRKSDSLKNITICKSIHALYASIWYGADTCVDKFQNAVPVGIATVPLTPHHNIQT